MDRVATILIVDDTPDSIEILSRLLKKEGYNILTASDGKNAIEVARREKPDIILMDYMMPEMDGFEATSIIKKESEPFFIPIIIITAIGVNIERRVSGFKSGADDYICKSFDKSEILARVRSMLRIKELHDELVTKNIELREMQGRLVKSEKLAALVKLSAGAAHEINNPLGIATGNVQYLAEWLNNKRKKVSSALNKAETKELDECLRIIHQSCLRCGTIVSQLLTFGDWAMPTPRCPIDINKIIEMVISMMNRQMKGSAIKINTDLKSLPPILASKEQMEHLFMNIFLNAEQAMPSGGILSIRTFVADKNICITISDTGVGIEEELLDRVFDPFFTTKSQGVGTGLGLSVSYGIVQAHNGTIRIDSIPKKETAVIVTLPIISEEKKI